MVKYYFIEYFEKDGCPPDNFKYVVFEDNKIWETSDFINDDGLLTFLLLQCELVGFLCKMTEQDASILALKGRNITWVHESLLSDKCIW